MADTCFYQKSITFAMYSLKIETILNYDSILFFYFYFNNKVKREYACVI